MELRNQKKLVNNIFRLLKVNEIVIPIGRTNKGNLGIKFSANQEDFEIYLDAVPLSTKSLLEDENNIELKNVLDKYLFDSVELSYQGIKIIPDEKIEKFMIVEVPKKLRGRPKKIK